MTNIREFETPPDIQGNKLKTVLIDDDKLIQLSWTLKAQSKGVDLVCFSSLEDFLRISSNFSFSSKIYIDSNLNNEVKGELVSKELYDIGFKSIYLTTGYQASDFDLEKLYWLKGVISKRPPF